MYSCILALPGSNPGAGVLDAGERKVKGAVHVAGDLSSRGVRNGPKSLKISVLGLKPLCMHPHPSFNVPRIRPIKFVFSR